MMRLTDYILSKGHRDIEGYSQQIPQQVADIERILDHHPSSSIRVLEIGFNAGHSAEVFLRHPNVASVVSFDLGSRPYVQDGKAYIDAVYGYHHRHTLVLGDSTVTVPSFSADHPAARFDVLFVDGGHDLVTAQTDLRHCMALAADKHAVILVDDVVQRPEWIAEYTVGPTTAVNEAVAAGTFQLLGSAEYGVGRGMCWGRVVTSL